MQRAIPSRHPPIIVASMGRSGSTLAWEAVCKGMAAARFDYSLGLGLRLVTDTAWDVGSQYFVPGVVYKTHGLAHELPANTRARVVFLFGSASDAVMSVLTCRDRYGEEWVKRHFTHMRATGSFDELIERDVLRIEEQLDGWLGRSGVPRLILHYDSLWDHVDALSDFVGFPVSLPPRRARADATAVDPGAARRCAEAYAALDARIEAMPRCQILT